MERMLAPRARTASNFSQASDFPILTHLDLERMLPETVKAVGVSIHQAHTKSNQGIRRVELEPLFYADF